MSAVRSDPAHPSICWDAAHAHETLAAPVGPAPTLRPQAVLPQVRDASSDSRSDAQTPAERHQDLRRACPATPQPPNLCDCTAGERARCADEAVIA